MFFQRGHFTAVVVGTFPAAVAVWTVSKYDY